MMLQKTETFVRRDRRANLACGRGRCGERRWFVLKIPRCDNPFSQRKESDGGGGKASVTCPCRSNKEAGNGDRTDSGLRGAHHRYECDFLLTFPSCLPCALVKQSSRWCRSLVISVRVHEQARCLTTRERRECRRCECVCTRSTVGGWSSLG